MTITHVVMFKADIALHSGSRVRLKCFISTPLIAFIFSD